MLLDSIDLVAALFGISFPSHVFPWFRAQNMADHAVGNGWSEVILRRDLLACEVEICWEILAPSAKHGIAGLPRFPDIRCLSGRDFPA